MNADQIDDLGADVSHALAQLADVMRERDFLRRVLRQAVLTHGGELRIDVTLADAATADRRALAFGGGCVTLITLP